MSNARAIAAVTATLRNLLQAEVEDEFAGATVSVQSPEKANPATNLVNLFLYETTINAAWRNRDMPRQVKPGETGQPPLALNLHYLLTAYGEDDDAAGPKSHRLLGRAMGFIHDNPILRPEDIRTAVAGEENLHDLYDQVEPVRITLMQLTPDEMSKVWAEISAKYRLSVVYEASVVLIESRRPSRTPLPVLRRGADDQGVDAQANLVAPYPTLTSISVAADKQPSAQLGDTLIIRGHHLDGTSATVRFTHPRLAAPIEIALPGIGTEGETEIEVPLPDDAGSRALNAAGSLNASLIITRNDPANPTLTTNELTFPLAPKIAGGIPQTPQPANTDLTLHLVVRPDVRPGQRASLLFGAREVGADDHSAGQTPTLSFKVTAPARGEYFVRVRIDGVDSLVIDYAHPPLKFDPAQKVTIV
ncbi:MAG: DUF4255 domain-containing protein [Acidobacteriota bacterium]